MFPTYRRIGGAPFNFAFHLKRLGFPIRFFSRIGKDEGGQEIADFLKISHLDSNDLQIDPAHSTGKVNVTIDGNNNPRFDIVPEAAYDYFEFDANIVNALNTKPDLIYFGSLLQRTDSGFRAIQKTLSQKPVGTRCLYDINLRPNCYNKKIISASLKHADVLKLNNDELHVLKDMYNSHLDENAFTCMLREKYKISMIAVTYGSNGSKLFTANGTNEISILPLEEFKDSVGAGDAYTAILAIGYLQNWPYGTILTEASSFASKICAIKGAIPGDDRIYESFKHQIKRHNELKTQK